MIRFAGLTHVGRRRSHNEDNLYLPVATGADGIEVIGGDALVLVADGMGGHASGEIASRLAIDTVADFFRSTFEESAVTWPYKMGAMGRESRNRLIVSIKLANLRIFETGQQDDHLRGMGTTIVGSLFTNEGVMVAHVGDSRVYRYRNGELVALTEDHSLLNDYMRMKRLTPEEAEAFPHKNVIVRALGMKETVQVDLYQELPRPGDIYLLCSDGLSSMVSDGDISRVMQESNDLEQLAQMLVDAANAAGGLDNVTVGLAQIEA